MVIAFPKRYVADNAEYAFEFKERPAAKSSTSILVSVPGQIACQVCGCLPADDKGRTKGRTKKGCRCKCHCDASHVETEEGAGGSCNQATRQHLGPSSVQDLQVPK